MKKYILLLLLLFVFGDVCAQDCFDKIARQAIQFDSLQKKYKFLDIKIDSLQKVIKSHEISKQQQLLKFQASQKKYLDTIEILNSDLLIFQKFKVEKTKFELRIKAKSDSLVWYNKEIITRDQEIKNISEKGIREAKLEKEKGKNEICALIAMFYRNKSFDVLIMSTSLSSVQFDKQLLGGNYVDVKQILLDLETYFNASNLVSKKFNVTESNTYLNQLGLIKQQSKLVDALKESLDNFKIVNDGLLLCIQNILALDNKESVNGMNENIIKLKFNKILAEISIYIFDYDFNFVEYPYLADVLFEIIKRKQPNPDADISDLLKRIN